MRLLILLISLSFLFGHSHLPQPDVNDVVRIGVVTFTIFVMSECVNCMFPYYDGKHENIGFVCKWTKDKFEYNYSTERWDYIKRKYRR